MKKLIKKLKHHLFLYKGSKNQATYIPERSEANVTTVAHGHYSVTTYKLIPVKILGIHVWYKMEPTKLNITPLPKKTETVSIPRIDFNSLIGARIKSNGEVSLNGKTINIYELTK